MTEKPSRLSGKGLRLISSHDDDECGLSRLRGSLLRGVDEKDVSGPVVIVTNRDGGDHILVETKEQPELSRTLARLRSVATGAMVSINAAKIDSGDGLWVTKHD